MARIGFDDEYVSGELEKVGNALTVPINLYLIVGAVTGHTKEELLSKQYSPIEGYWEEHQLIPEIDEIAKRSFKIREPPEIKGTGHVVRALEAALWAFHNSDSFKDGCLLAVNLGDDADTTGAIYG